MWSARSTSDKQFQVQIVHTSTLLGFFSKAFKLTFQQGQKAGVVCSSIAMKNITTLGKLQEWKDAVYANPGQSMLYHLESACGQESGDVIKIDAMCWL